MEKYKYICTECGSDNIKWDAWAAYNEETQEMELDNWFDNTYCIECDGECSINKVPMEEK